MQYPMDTIKGKLVLASRVKDPGITQGGIRRNNYICKDIFFVRGLADIKGQDIRRLIFTQEFKVKRPDFFVINKTNVNLAGFSFFY